MMLQALIAYAEREHLGDADFQPVGVRWVISLDAGGTLAGQPIPVAANPDDKKPRPKPMLRPFTSPNELNQGDKSHFLCDSLERTILMVDAQSTPARRVQHEYFKALLGAAATACPNEAPRLQALLAFLNDAAALSSVRARLSDAKAKKTDNVTFSVTGQSLLDSDTLKDFWRKRRASLAKPKKTRVCIGTGQLTETLDTHEKIKGVPGGKQMDRNLIAFNKECPSFESFGLVQAQNAALSPAAELKMRSALNRLIEISHEQRLIFSDTAYLHWTRQPVRFDPVDPVVSGDPNAVEHLLSSVQRGQQVVGLDANAYYALSLSGNGARIVVRDWLESTVPQVAENVSRWFTDLAIVDIYKDGAHVRRDFSLWSLLATTVLRKDNKPDFEKLAPQTGSEALFAALRGTPPPQTILVAALKRQQLEQRRPTDKYDPKLNPARMAFIKACLLRSPNRKETDTMTERLDTESEDRAYLCGQLFAVVGRLQLLALGRVGASIADRTYGGVATRPATTLGPVFTKLPPYLKKANTRFPGSGTNKQKEIECLCTRIKKVGGFPMTLGLEEQGRFALGYYCQLAQYRADRAEADAADKAETLPEEAT